MSDDQIVSAWNPLDDLGISQRELNKTIIREFEEHDGEELPEPYNPFDGCGVYGLYYFGDYENYEPVSNDKWEYDFPIYIGKAVPSGSRTGGAHLESSTGRGIYKRLLEHRKSIEQAENLDIDNFRVKYLITSSIWIRYCEQTLISYYKPWWNRYIDGFGDHDPGKGRANQERSVWDTLHPGRGWVEKRDLPRRDTEPNVWEEEVQPKVDAEWRRENVKSLSVTEEEVDGAEDGELTDFA
ncbi:Eco29kI restriction endonuclease [Haloarcula virus HJTV-2]|uniref:Eco29kI restriction endonuclease n=1 Tax=Haloarcula virus HJTV-2 TaxID=2877986 RepID=A0AAE8XY38_9CAUD|nr:Eco29kI restriction endonuclease [Haloarcula virus HJTV-2]UBF21666.1 Eco29kI restriction endonuclease [Haloarcula virus HJTV-2]